MANLDLHLLGLTQVKLDGAYIEVKPRKALALLIYLAVTGERHSRDALATLLWSESSQSTARKSLRSRLSELNQTLGEDWIEADRESVGLRDGYWLDVAEFQSTRAGKEGNAQSLMKAADLYRDDFMTGFTLPDCPEFDKWQFFQVESLRQSFATTLETLINKLSEQRKYEEAIPYSRRWLALDPLHEPAHRVLMQLYAQAGQRSAALDVYETCRRILAAELGLAPAVETVTLAEQIRALAPLDMQATRAVLPPVLTRFFGRQQESARLVDLLSRRTVRLVTLAGPGGVGKTRLSIEVAHRMAGVFAHDICFVELAGVADESSVDDAVAAALRLPTTGRSSTVAIVDYLRDKAMLLVLDNCEHLVEACSRLVQILYREAARLTVLATSRIPLRLEDEHVVRLEPFTTPAINDSERLTVADSLSFDSVQLFTNRAAQSLLHFTLTDANVLAVARICQQLDGIPLAIEIAAAQVRVLPIEAIAERLGQRFAWLNRQVTGTLPRQRTLHTLIDWSYGLLNDQERSVLRQLAVFAGGWTLEAAEAISAPGMPCAEILAELVDHSLVIFGADAGRRRYSMHETIRQFVQEQLHGSEQEADALERHARYYAELVSQAAEKRTGQPFTERLRTAVDDHDNVRRAFEWLVAHDGEQALALVARLGTELNFWELGGFFQEGRRWLQRALENTEGTVSLSRGYVLLAAADLSSAITDFDYGLQCIQQAQQLFQQLGDQRGEIDARLRYCNLAELVGETADLQARIEEALRMAEQVSYTAGIAKAKRLLATIIENTTGETEVAIQYSLASVALWREVQDPFELAGALNNLGADLVEVHEFAAARQALLECQELYQSLGYQRGVALALHNLGCAAQEMGEYAGAREILCQSLRIRHDLGLPRGYPYSFESLAKVSESEQRYEQAVQLLAAAHTLRVRIGAPLDSVAQKQVTAVLANARTHLGDIAFELAWSKGAAMTTEQAIALALS